MQKLVCELCRSNNFTKDDDGYFVCDYCRTRYTQTQAQAMMVEGTVRLDRSGEIANLLTMGTSALASNNYQEAYDYANRVLEIDPQDSAAWFLKGSSAGWLSNLQQLRLKEMQNAFERAIENASDADRDEMRRRCADDTNVIAVACDYMSWTHTNEFASVDSSWPEHINRSEEVLAALVVSFNWDRRKLPLENYVTIASNLIFGVPYEFFNGNSMQRSVRTLNKEYKAYVQSQIDWAGEQIKELDPTYVTPHTKTQSSGCFVVTATMGNEESLPVLTLRDFRDHVLVDFSSGRRFIDWYHDHGPSLAQKIEGSRFLRLSSLVLIVLPATTAAWLAMKLRSPRR